MTSDRPVRYAVVGFGLGGSLFHAPFIEATPGAELTAVVTANPGRAAQVRAEYPGATVVAGVEELPPLGVDVAVVTTPNDSHASVAISAMEAGMAVVVDKPMAATVADAERMIAVAERSGTLLTCYQNRRWDGDFLTVRKLRDEGRLGRILRFESRFERWRPEVKSGWKEVPSPGAGVLFDLGPHVVDQAIALLGPVVAVHSEVRILRDGAQVPDDAFLALTHEQGAISHVWVSATAAAPGPRFRVLGSQAAYVKDGVDVQEEALRRGERPHGDSWGAEPPDRWGRLVAAPDAEPVPTVPGDYREFYRLFTEAVRSRGVPPVDPWDSVNALRILEAAQAG